MGRRTILMAIFGVVSCIFIVLICLLIAHFVKCSKCEGEECEEVPNRDYTTNQYQYQYGYFPYDYQDMLYGSLLDALYSKCQDDYGKATHACICDEGDVLKCRDYAEMKLCKAAIAETVLTFIFGIILCVIGCFMCLPENKIIYVEKNQSIDMPSKPYDHKGTT